MKNLHLKATEVDFSAYTKAYFGKLEEICNTQDINLTWLLTKNELQLDDSKQASLLEGYNEELILDLEMIRIKGKKKASSKVIDPDLSVFPEMELFESRESDIDDDFVIVRDETLPSLN